MTQNEPTRGIVLGLCAYGIWGCFPLFFKLLTHVPAVEVLTHRIIWSCLFVAVLLLLQRRWQAVRATLRKQRALLTLFASSLLIATNWGVFIWAVEQQQVLEASLGYFLTPLVNVLLGMLLLQERLSRFQQLAVLLAIIGVGYQLVALGKLPWISLTLAITFGFYGLARKRVPVDTYTGLLLETLLLLPFALVYLGWLAQQGGDHFFQGTGLTPLLLILSGVLTALPLLTFAAAAARLSLTVIGLMLYIAPSMHFLIAVLLFDEPFNTVQLVTFACIWTGLVLFTGDSLRRHRRARRPGGTTQSLDSGEAST